jgi:predicted N-formylglutamate amidohydrolase
VSLRIHGVVLSCEHATNAVPHEYRALFRGYNHLLDSHRGFDRGAMTLARSLSRALDVPVTAAGFTRLLIDANRTLNRRSLFSEATQSLDRESKQKIIATYLEPHRHEVLARARAVAGHRHLVLHIGVHTFTPRLRGQRRRSDVSLLYDPARPREAELARAWRATLRAAEPRWRVRRNYPFLGKLMGLSGWLRLQLPPDRYLGIELEVNQRFYRDAWPRTCRRVVESVERLLPQFS